MMFVFVELLPAGSTCDSLGSVSLPQAKKIEVWMPASPERQVSGGGHPQNGRWVSMRIGVHFVPTCKLNSRGSLSIFAFNNL
jgi:hypothetical protein